MSSEEILNLLKRWITDARSSCKVWQYELVIVVFISNIVFCNTLFTCIGDFELNLVFWGGGSWAILGSVLFVGPSPWIYSSSPSLKISMIVLYWFCTACYRFFSRSEAYVCVRCLCGRILVCGWVVFLRCRPYSDTGLQHAH